MTAKQEIEALGIKLHHEHPSVYPSVEAARVEVRKRHQELARQEHSEQNARIFGGREAAKSLSLQFAEASPTFALIDERARKLMTEHPDRYPTPEIARTAIRSIHPELRDREAREEIARRRSKFRVRDDSSRKTAREQEVLDAIATRTGMEIVNGASLKAALKHALSKV